MIGYIGSTSTNFYKKIEYWNNFLEKEHELTKESLGQFLASMNSYLGIMGQYSTYKLRKKMLTENLSLRFNDYICISNDYDKLSAKI